MGNRILHRVQRKKGIKVFRLCDALTKLDQLSENSSFGSPRLAMNLLRAARNASVVRSISDWLQMCCLSVKTDKHTYVVFDEYRFSSVTLLGVTL